MVSWARAPPASPPSHLTQAIGQLPAHVSRFGRELASYLTRYSAPVALGVASGPASISSKGLRWWLALLFGASSLRSGHSVSERKATESPRAPLLSKQRSPVGLYASMWRMRRLEGLTQRQMSIGNLG